MLRMEIIMTPQVALRLTTLAAKLTTRNKGLFQCTIVYLARTLALDETGDLEF